VIPHHFGGGVSSVPEAGAGIPPELKYKLLLVSKE